MRTCITVTAILVVHGGKQDRKVVLWDVVQEQAEHLKYVHNWAV